MKSMWHSKRRLKTENRFVAPQHVHAYMWTTKFKAAPEQVPCFDTFTLAKSRYPRISTERCNSIMHRQRSTCPTALHPFGPFLFQKNMCTECVKLNLAPSSPGVMERHAAALELARPKTAKEMYGQVTAVCKTRLHTLLTTVKRVHLVATMDTRAHHDYTDMFALAKHGTAVTLFWYYFPDVWAVRSNALSIVSEMPMNAYSRYSLLTGVQHRQFAKFARRLGVAATANAFKLANAGRVRLETEIDGIDDELFLPFTSYNQAATGAGLRPTHTMVSVSTAWFTSACVRVLHALGTGALRLHIHLVPPVELNALRPAISASDQKRRVTHLPIVGKSPDITTAYRDYSKPFWCAEHVSYEWLAYMIDLHTMAAERCRIPPPPFTLKLCGSYYHAACRQTVINRDTGTHDEDDDVKSLQLGGVFQELVDSAAKDKTIFGASVVLVPSVYNDMLNYSDLPEAELNRVSGIVYTEQTYLIDDDDCAPAMASQAIAQFCCNHGYVQNKAHEAHDPPLNKALVQAMAKITVHNTLADRLGTDSFTLETAKSAVQKALMPVFPTNKSK